MSVVENQVEVTESFVLSPDGRTNAYYLTSPLTTSSGGRSLTLSLPSNQGTDGQVLTRSGAGTVWGTPSGGVSISLFPSIIFSTAFTQSTTSGVDYIQFPGSSGVDTNVCRFYYPGSLITPITTFMCIMGNGASTPTGTISIRNGLLTVASITFDGIVSTPTVYTTSAINNLPLTPSILNVVITIGGSNTRRINLYSLTVN